MNFHKPKQHIQFMYLNSAKSIDPSEETHTHKKYILVFFLYFLKK